MNLRAAYRDAPESASQAAEMLATLRKRDAAPGDVYDRAQDMTNQRIAYLRGFIDGAD